MMEAQDARTDLNCVETDKRGWCATQVQSRVIAKGELAVGMWSICEEWLQGRDGVTKRAPTCPDCRKRLGLV